MILASMVFVIGLLATLIFYGLNLRGIPKTWKEKTTYTVDRVEKACDSVTALIAFLIPAALAITTWVYEKTGVRWYGACLAVGTLWFLVVLCFTMYLRFNFLWRHVDKIEVGNGLNLDIVRWLTTVMVGLTVGLIFLAVPIFFIAFHTTPSTPGGGVTAAARCQNHVRKHQGSRQPRGATIPESGGSGNGSSAKEK